MPGIAGIISIELGSDEPQLAGAMVTGLVPGDATAVNLIAEIEPRVAAGWTGNEKSGDSPYLFTTADGAFTLLLYGTCFPDDGEAERLRSEGRAEAEYTNGWILARYERQGEAFLESLNGLFSGVLIDRRRRKVLLFTDRYGLERLYVHERAGTVYFASEAKAILRVVAETRSFDDDGVSQFFAYGVTHGETTLFRGVRVLPGGSCWTFENGLCRKWRYFTPDVWEGQERLGIDEFTEELLGLLARIVPRYGASNGPLGISLTAGLDTRMVMACLPAVPDRHVCFTYSGQHIDPLDAQISAKVAQACGLTHHILRIKPDFFVDFGSMAERTVTATDGCFGVLGAHEIYMSRQARKLAPCRLTGNYGSEILRGVSTFKPLGLPAGLIASDLQAGVEAAVLDMSLTDGHPVTFAAFKETPWNLFGNLQAGRTEIGFRTPYLDNDFVKLAYRGPSGSARDGRKICESVVRRQHPDLARIPTDKGYLGTDGGVARGFHQFLAKVAFKCDYFHSTGFPSALSPIEPLFTSAMQRFGLLGQHKHLTYRSWMRNELSGWLRERLNDPGVLDTPFWNRSAVARLADDHIAGRRNCLNEINAVLTLRIVEERLLKQGGATPNSMARS